MGNRDSTTSSTRQREHTLLMLLMELDQLDQLSHNLGLRSTHVPDGVGSVEPQPLASEA